VQGRPKQAGRSLLPPLVHDAVQAHALGLYRRDLVAHLRGARAQQRPGVSSCSELRLVPQPQPCTQRTGLLLLDSAAPARSPPAAHLLHLLLPPPARHLLAHFPPHHLVLLQLLPLQARRLQLGLGALDVVPRLRQVVKGRRAAAASAAAASGWRAAAL
jgi:hypothetical protein